LKNLSDRVHAQPAHPGPLLNPGVLFLPIDVKNT
jgi:hypothetical protein